MTDYEFAPAAIQVFADDLALGGATTCALRNGDVQCWGNNNHGQLGNATSVVEMAPQPVSIDGDVVSLVASGRRVCATVTTGDTHCWGEAGIPADIADDTTVMRELPSIDGALLNATAIGLGSYHTCALRADGAVGCRGRGLEGQLGNGFTMDAQTFVEPQLDCPAP